MEKLPPPKPQPVVEPPSPSFVKGGIIGIVCGVLAVVIPQAVLALVIFALGYIVMKWRA